MVKNQKTTLWKPAVIVIAIVVAIPVISYGIAEYAYQLRVQKLVSALNQIGQNELKPIGGINTFGASSDAECRLAINALFSIDTGPCPRAASEWQVPVVPGKETAFITDLLSKEGYSVHINANTQTGFPMNSGGVKSGVGLNIEMITNKSTQPTQPAPEGKQWLQLGVTATESK